MNILSIINTALQAQGIDMKANENGQFSNITYNPMDQYGVMPDEHSMDYQNIYQIQSTVHKCISVISNKFASVPVKIYTKNDDQEETILTDDPAFEIFKNPNPWQTVYDFWEAVIGYLDMTGESFVLKIFEGSKLVCLIPLRPDKMKIFPSATKQIDHYEFTNGSKRIKIPAENILYLRYFHPTSDYRGLSPMRASFGDIKLDLKAMAVNDSTLKNNSRPSGVVSTDQGLGDHQWARYQGEFAKKYVGALNAGKVIFLDHGMKWDRVGFSAEDMQYIEQCKWTKDTVREVYGVPPIYLMDFSDASVLANADVQAKLLWTETLLPKIVKISAIMQKFMMPLLTPNEKILFGFDVSEIVELQQDRNELMKRYNTAFKDGGVSPNDIREFVLKLPRDDNPAMDLMYLPANVMPIGTTEVVVDDEKHIQLGKSIKEYIASHQGNNVSADLVATLGVVSKLMNDADDSVHIIKAGSVIAQIENKFVGKFSKKLIALFNQQRNEVVSNLNAFKIIKYDPATVNINQEKWVQKFEDAGEPFIFGSFEFAGGQMSEELGGVFNSTDPSAVRHVQARTHKYAELVNGTTYKEVNQILATAIDEGLSIAQTQGLIKDYFNNNKEMRSTRIARTETVRSGNFGRMTSMKQMKVKYNRWVTQGDDAVRDSHSASGGAIRKVGQPFPVGAGYSGDPAFPSDINERCFTIPTKKKGL